MIANNLQNGSVIATEVPIQSTQFTEVRISPKTVSNLLDSLQQAHPKGFAMLRSTCAILSSYLDKPASELTVQEVFDSKDSLRDFLESRKYAENSIRTYVNNQRILLQQAQIFGWKPSNDLSAAWQKVMDCVTSANGRSLVSYLAKNRNTPQEVIEEDVLDWSSKKVCGGTSIITTRKISGSFWRILKELDLGGDGAKNSPSCYGIPTDQFPSKMQSEVKELTRWKQANFAPGRPKNGQIREVTAHGMDRTFRKLYGYAIKVRGEKEIVCLADLITESIVTGFVEWRINERKVKGQSIITGLASLHAALRHHPAFKTMDISWFDPLMASIPAEPESEMRARKAEKYVDYARLEAIPAKIRESRLKSRKGPLDVAQYVQDELLIKWLTVLPWRQRNIRESRIDGPKPNIFKGPIPRFSDIAKPEWVLQEEQQNPAARFWQFHFAPHETKTHIDVHSLMPKQLIPLLEEFITIHRPVLLKGNSSHTLFVNEEGNPATERKIGQSVSELALRYAGSHTSPHRFRDILAYTWLEHHPNDYLSLSKLLWHRNINTTLKEYGSRFNESNGVAAMEAWLEQRSAGSE